MVTHVAYEELHARTAADCIGMIRHYLALGWQISQLRGPETGPFVILFRKDDAA